MTPDVLPLDECNRNQWLVETGIEGVSSLSRCASREELNGLLNKAKASLPESVFSIWRWDPEYKSWQGELQL